MRIESEVPLPVNIFYLSYQVRVLLSRIPTNFESIALIADKLQLQLKGAKAVNF